MELINKLTFNLHNLQIRMMDPGKANHIMALGKKKKKKNARKRKKFELWDTSVILTWWAF